MSRPEFQLRIGNFELNLSADTNFVIAVVVHDAIR